MINLEIVSGRSEIDTMSGRLVGHFTNVRDTVAVRGHFELCAAGSR